MVVPKGQKGVVLLEASGFTESCEGEYFLRPTVGSDDEGAR